MRHLLAIEQLSREEIEAILGRAESFAEALSYFPDVEEYRFPPALYLEHITKAKKAQDEGTSQRVHRLRQIQGFLGDQSRVPGVTATPGAGTHVPLYILGSSHFGAQLAAALGLPYAFASHFSPQALQSAVAIYREQFRPSAQLAEPFVIAGYNVIAADTVDEAEEQLQITRRSRVRLLFGRGGRTFTDEEADLVIASPQGRAVEEMMTYTAAGTADHVVDQVEAFAKHADADEVMVAHQGPTLAHRLRSVELLATAAFAD